MDELASSLQTATVLLPRGCRVSACLAYWNWVLSICTLFWLEQNSHKVLMPKAQDCMVLMCHRLINDWPWRAWLLLGSLPLA